MTDGRSDAGKSFSLTRKPVQPSQSQMESLPHLSWEEQAYDRLKVLYGVSRLLSSFDSVEKTFPQILNLCATAFPFVTGVLIEKRGSKTTIAMWHADNVTREQIYSASDNARKSFSYLTGSSLVDSYELLGREMDSALLDGVFAQSKAGTTNPQNYISIPLVVDGLAAFGILQLDGSVPLLETDLEFVDALASLIAVAVDRNYKTEVERRVRETEAAESSVNLSISQANVSDLEIERDMRETFVSLLTHDLRTPMSAAKISAQLIQRQSDISGATQSLAARIVSNIARADQMVTDLLDSSRVRSGEKLPLQIESFDLADLVKQTLEELATVHGDRFAIRSDARINCHWDRKYVRRTLENLVGNAIKYGDSHGQITVTLRQVGETVFLDVHNQGEPIPTEDQRTLFQQFRRSRTADGGRKKGWGIGLTLVRGVAEAHGGTVKLVSEPGQGTVFTVSLPVDSRPFIAEGKE